jgi:hypothetical protein
VARRLSDGGETVNALDLDELRAVRRIIVHANCPDGLASAMILHDVLPDAAIEFVGYNTKEHREMKAEPGMLFCDFSPHRSRVTEMVEAGAIILDHHEHARDITEAFGERGVFGENSNLQSGAWLAYDHVWRALEGVGSGAVGGFATLIAVRDTWASDHPHWQRACEQAEALRFYGVDYLLDDHPPWQLGEERVIGELLFAKNLKHAREIAEHGCFRFRDAALFNGLESSDVAEAMREIDPKVNIVAGYKYTVGTDGELSIVFSLRSCAEGVDVGAIAKANGGGGHIEAAGFALVVITAEGRIFNGHNPIEIFKRALTTARES